MRKYNGNSNITGQFIEKTLIEKNITKEELCQKLQLMGINIDRFHLYKIVNGKVILKDFELIAICIILDIDLNKLKDFISQ